MKFFSHIQSTHNGFSLVETIVVIALFTIVSLVLSSNIATFYRLNAYTLAQSYQVDTARRGIDIMVQDLREMTYSDSGTFPLVSMDDYSVSFYSDIDRDNSVEYVEYSLASTTLYKKVFSATGTPPVYNMSTPESTVTLSEYVQNELQAIPIFVYYTGDGSQASGTSTVTDIRYIEATVIVNIDPIRDPGQYKLRSSAALRNLIY